MKQEKNKNGITLIALIITVIVMMILIGVTISLITSNNLTRIAEDAVEQYNNQMVAEGNLSEIEVDGKTYPSLEAYLQKLSGEIPWLYETNEDGTITITGIDFTIFDSSSEKANYATTDLGIDTLVFPSKLDGKIVTAVDWKDLVIPVENIVANSYADIELPGIKKIIFSDTIVSVDAGTNDGEDDYSFKLIFPDAEEVILPNGLETIGDRFFAAWGVNLDKNETKLDLYIPASVTKIEGLAFTRVKTVYLRPGTFTESDVDTAGRWGADEVIIDYGFQVGDYVNYNPTISTLSGTAVDSDKIYYKSTQANNGFADQEFQATTDVKWRIFDYDPNAGTVSLISAQPVNSITNAPLTFYGMGVEDELNTICSIFGWGYAANEAMSIEPGMSSAFEILVSPEYPDGATQTFLGEDDTLLNPLDSTGYWVNATYTYDGADSSYYGRYFIRDGGLQYSDLTRNIGGLYPYVALVEGSASIRPVVIIDYDKLDIDNPIVSNGVTTFNLK